MKKKHFTILSSDGRTSLHGIRWTPEGEIRGVLQLIHGMSEYIDRYDGLASWLCEYGIAVIGHDHLGHGDSIASPADLGFFAEKNGKAILLKDIRRVNRIAKNLYPDRPVFMLGHSFGSFLLRRYMTLFGNEIAGAIVCGTGDYEAGEISLVKSLAETIADLRGDHHVSLLLDQLMMGSLRIRFGQGLGRKSGSWLSLNEDNVAAYEADPMCGFPFTARGYADFLDLLTDLANHKDMGQIPRELPVLLISGMEDAVGGFTRKVLSVYNRYILIGMKDVDMFFYPEDRHEILQEKDRERVFDDIRAWIEERI